MDRLSSLKYFFHVVLLQALLQLSNSQPFLGINYGEVADNLPAPSATVKLLQGTTIEKVRLYGTDPAMIKALANTGIGIVIGASNGEIPSLASDPSAAASWVGSNVVPYYPASDIIMITVGNEIYYSKDRGLMDQLVPAMRNLDAALKNDGIGGGKVKVSTVNAMNALVSSDPPSSGRFDPVLTDLVKAQLEFLNETGSPFPINPYPYFGYQSDPRPETLAFCLFQDNPGRVDAGTNIKYMNMFDAQVDAVRSAINAMGFQGVEIVVAETGWPYKGDSNEAGASLDNAKAYNGNLISHLRSMVGTPLMPGKSIDTYLFALYDEDLKPGATSERSFGIFKPDLTMTYDIGLSKSTQGPSVSKSPSPIITITTTKPDPTTTTTSSPTNDDQQQQPKPNTNPGSNNPATGASIWCVPKQGVSDQELQANLDYACGLGLDCSPILPGGPCFEPNNLQDHAAYAMNLLYQRSGRNPLSCDFSQTALISSQNPSYAGCKYPDGGT